MLTANKVSTIAFIVETIPKYRLIDVMACPAGMTTNCPFVEEYVKGGWVTVLTSGQRARQASQSILYRRGRLCVMVYSRVVAKVHRLS